MADQSISTTEFRATKHYQTEQPNELSVSLAALQQLAHLEGPQFWEILVAVFDNLKRGLIVADRDGRVVVFNQSAQDMMGYRAGEVIGKLSLWDFCEDCNRPPLFPESLLQGRSFLEEEVEMTRKDGKGRPVGVKVTPLYGSGGILIGAMAALRSLDELRAREREHKSLVRMASIGRIISAIAHEINNPLQAVRTSIELGLDPRKSPQRRQEYLQTADHEITRIARVIGQMRDFYRPTPGEKQPTDVTLTLGQALGWLDKKIQQAKVEVDLDLSADLPTVSVIDYQLQQVFLNLILNALEAMPEGGRLTISGRLDPEGTTVLILFSDSAAPTDPAEAVNVFDPFAPHGRVGALALGLSVSREIITELGGSIEPLDGNTVVVRLPC